MNKMYTSKDLKQGLNTNDDEGAPSFLSPSKYIQENIDSSRYKKDQVLAAQQNEISDSSEDEYCGND